MTRIFVDLELSVGTDVALPSAAAHHLVQVLRKRNGAPVTLFNGRGGEYACVIGSQSRRETIVTVVDYTDIERESPLEITLAQGISRGERMDYSIQKAVELGVHRIVPVHTQRTAVRLSAKRAERRMEHWRGVIRHACEQSGRNRLPVLTRIQSLEQTLASNNCEVGVVMNPEGSDNLALLGTGTKSILLVIGPEGGLDEAELERLQKAEFLNLRLGPRILRTETAAVVGLTLLQASLGDLGSST